LSAAGEVEEYRIVNGELVRLSQFVTPNRPLARILSVDDKRVGSHVPEPKKLTYDE
jgi:hypothetical protein